MSAKRTPGRPASGREPTCHVSFRLDLSTLGRVDGVIPAVSTPWRAAKRSDVLRALILEGLQVLEARHAAKPKDVPRA